MLVLLGIVGFATSALLEKSRVEEDALVREIAEELYLERQAAEEKQRTERNAP